MKETLCFYLFYSRFSFIINNFHDHQCRCFISARHPVIFQIFCLTGASFLFPLVSSFLLFTWQLTRNFMDSVQINANCPWKTSQDLIFGQHDGSWHPTFK